MAMNSDNIEQRIAYYDSFNFSTGSSGLCHVLFQCCCGLSMNEHCAWCQSEFFNYLRSDVVMLPWLHVCRIGCCNRFIPNTSCALCNQEFSGLEGSCLTYHSDNFKKVFSFRCCAQCVRDLGVLRSSTHVMSTGEISERIHSYIQRGCSDDLIFSVVSRLVGPREVVGMCGSSNNRPPLVNLRFRRPFTLEMVHSHLCEGALSCPDGDSVITGEIFNPLLQLVSWDKIPSIERELTQ